MYLVLRTETFAKLFFLISCTGLILYAILAFYTFRTAYTTMIQVQNPEGFVVPNLDLELTDNTEMDDDLKYILFWRQSDDPNDDIPDGQSIFSDHRCDFANCYLTTNKTMFKSAKFHAIVFNISVINDWKKFNMPQKRSPKQKFIFYSLQSSNDNPVCNIKMDNFFNWTWTYKLNSDIVSPFIEVTDLKGNIVAPKLNVDWSRNASAMDDENVVDVIIPKQKTLIWIMDNCNLSNKKSAFIKELKAELEINLLDFDIYGCGNLKCPSGDCSKIINKYYFYLLYEDDVQDYVTKEVIKAYNHGAIPVIVGGADYRKFLPDGSYIKAQSAPADQVAAKIDYILRNPSAYHSYFTWNKMYSIHETQEFTGLCALCNYLNDKNKFESFSVYQNFRKWWYPGSLYNKCIPKGAKSLAEILAYINSSFPFEKKYKQKNSKA